MLPSQTYSVPSRLHIGFRVHSFWRLLQDKHTYNSSKGPKDMSIKSQTVNKKVVEQN